MCDFKPGDEVVCVDIGPSKCGGRWGGDLVKGQVYTVWGITPYTDFYGDHGVALVELDAPDRPDCPELQFFAAWRFRKVQRRDLSAWLETAAKNTDALDKPRRAPAKERA